jgi:hypothetical protein
MIDAINGFLVDWHVLAFMVIDSYLTQLSMVFGRAGHIAFAFAAGVTRCELPRRYIHCL